MMGNPDLSDSWDSDVLWLSSPSGERFPRWLEGIERHVPAMWVWNPKRVLVVDAHGFGEPPLSRCGGLGWLQRARREGATGPALVLSWLSADVLALEFPIIAKGVPGSGLLRWPVGWDEIRKEARRLRALSAPEWGTVVRWHSGLQNKWRGAIHALVGHVGQAGDRLRILEEWTALRDEMMRLAPDLQDDVEAVERNVREFDGQALRASLQSLSESLSGAGPTDVDLPKDVPNEPPDGLRSLAVFDDNGYEEASLLGLRNLGYDLPPRPARTRQEAEFLLEQFAPQVVLADLHFPEEQDGLDLMRRAVEHPSVALVLAISKGDVPPGLLPPGVQDCSGPNRYHDPDLIHRLIWSHHLRESARR